MPEHPNRLSSSRIAPVSHAKLRKRCQVSSGREGQVRLRARQESKSIQQWGSLPRLHRGTEGPYLSVLQQQSVLSLCIRRDAWPDPMQRVPVPLLRRHHNANPPEHFDQASLVIHKRVNIPARKPGFGSRQVLQVRRWLVVRERGPFLTLREQLRAVGLARLRTKPL